MASVMIIRHAERGDEINAPKSQLSPKGIADSQAFGKKITGSLIDQAGGSLEIRTYQTLLNILLTAGLAPKILGGDIRLGSEKQIFKDFGAAARGFSNIQKECGSAIKALRIVLDPDKYAFLKFQLLDAIKEACMSDGNVLLCTHSPQMELAIEIITGEQCNLDIKELDWFVVEMIDGDFKIVASNIKGLNL